MGPSLVWTRSCVARCRRSWTTLLGKIAMISYPIWPSCIFCSFFLGHFYRYTHWEVSDTTFQPPYSSECVDRRRWVEVSKPSPLAIWIKILEALSRSNSIISLHPEFCNKKTPSFVTKPGVWKLCKCIWCKPSTVPLYWTLRKSTYILYLHVVYTFVHQQHTGTQPVGNRIIYYA